MKLVETLAATVLWTLTVAAYLCALVDLAPRADVAFDAYILQYACVMSA